MPSSCRIAIVGGGLAGLAAANALRTVGMKPDVFEAAPALAEIGAVTSVGSRGDSYDNAAAESLIGLFKTELIRRRGPWRGLDHVELATLEWVDWHNNRRLHSACHDLTPVEYEQVFYGHHPAQQTVGVSQP